MLCYKASVCVVVTILTVLDFAIYAMPQTDDGIAEPPLPNQPNSTVQLHYNDTINEDTTYYDENTTTEDSGDNSCDCVCGLPNRKQRIVGGQVTKVNEFPWVVELMKRGKFYCAGSLITRRHVLTAAHCVDGYNAKDIRAVLGEHDRVSKTETVTVERKLARAIVYANFSILTFNNDIAVLELESPVELNATVRPACLPADGTKNYVGRMGIVVGWGRTDERRPTSTALRKVAVPIMSKEECSKSGYSNNRITENMFCAGYPDGKKDACQGDSGGPLHVDGERGFMEAVGIVSWGRGCARPYFPGIYTKVANYLDWIHQQIGDECMCPPPL
ncbi:Plasma kallikrein [Zootermopsis nevadensis]|uniref:Plasma kallikrein n=2 Tax=Zootermopsis nevadensis TaxID=136037 RepID=A0A067QKT3_ZOONE|nr:Plasma kallikrein [Zootermopsis nevadensis]